jgi:hypothetical protein
MSYINYVPLTSEKMFINSLEDAKMKYDEYNKNKYINVDSYKDALYIVAMCNTLKEDLSLLCLKLRIQHATDYKNIYPLFIAAPYLVDIDAMITENGIYPLVQTCKKYRNTPLALSAIRFINAYDYRSLNEGVKTRFIRDRSIYADVFLLDTFKVKDIETTCDYITAQSPSCIPKVKLPSTILGKPKQYYVDLMYAQSYGLLNGFPWSAACITGGFVEKVLSETITQCPYSDIDVWIIGENYAERKKNMDTVLNHIINVFGESKCYLINRRSVIDIYIEDIPRSVQIISNDRSTMYDIISTFDLSHCSHGYDNGTFYCTAESIESLKTRCTKGVCISNTNPKRIIKAIMANYDVAEEVYNLQEILAVLTDDKQIKSIMYTIIASWYPTSSPDVDPETRRLYNTAMLVRDSNNEVVDIKTALLSAVIGGCFNNNYAVTPFMKTNVTASMFKSTGYYSKNLFENGQKLTIQSDTMVITSFKIDTLNATDFTVILTADPSSKFREFLSALKEEYKAIWKSKTDIQMDNLLIKLNSKRINYLHGKNQSIVVSNTNEPLDYNVLCAGVNVQITFTIATTRNANDFNKAFTFNIIKVVVV